MRGAAIAVALGILAVAPRPTGADDASESAELVQKARLTFESFMSDRDLGPTVRAHLKRARGIVIAPQILRGAFIVGVSGGSGVMLARDDKGEWAGPAFQTIAGASFGLQAGGDSSEVILLAMTERGVSALLSHSVKLGADVGVALGPVGIGAAAETANISADILSWSRATGAYAGASLKGAIVAMRDDWNDAYYGKAVSPTDILIRHQVTNPKSKELVDAVANAAGAQ
jgi:lipid-binding SYLF domain-containing protein